MENDFIHFLKIVLFVYFSLMFFQLKKRKAGKQPTNLLPRLFIVDCIEGLLVRFPEDAERYCQQQPVFVERLVGKAVSLLIIGSKCKGF